MTTKVFSQFFAYVNIVAPRAKNGQIFAFFAIVKHRYGKTLIISGTIIARTNPKTTFERELNLETDDCRQI